MRAKVPNGTSLFGALEETPFGARVVASTNRDLETAIDEQRFREDLYYARAFVANRAGEGV